jgi:hypothetical protein
MDGRLESVVDLPKGKVSASPFSSLPVGQAESIIILVCQTHE